MRSCVFIVVVATMALLAPVPDVAGQKQSAVPEQYLRALHVADLFLTAWVERTPDTGLALVSARTLAADADSSRPDLRSGLRQYLTGLSNPHHEAFEIEAGRVLGPDRIVFPVRLFELYLGEPAGLVFSDSLELVLQEGEWRVDRVPRTYDPD